MNRIIICVLFFLKKTYLYLLWSNLNFLIIIILDFHLNKNIFYIFNDKNKLVKLIQIPSVTTIEKYGEWIRSSAYEALEPPAPI